MDCEKDNCNGVLDFSHIIEGTCIEAWQCLICKTWYEIEADELQDGW
jgi:hypothetical protein|tara:strand:+ start:2376 stop:2516 length:141 start_codon:yes stop_codon:yes gene_type:complete